MSGPPLFVYGTLAVPMYRRALLGHVPVLGRARLCGYQLRQAAGYVFARSLATAIGEPAPSIDGLLLALSDTQMTLADRWEDVPVYRRVTAGVIPIPPTGDGVREAWVYIREDVAGQPVDSAAWTAGSRLDVLSEIARVHL